MQNDIERILVKRVSEVIPLTYMLAQEDILPYAVYEVENMAPIMSKQSICGYVCQAYVYIVAAAEDQAAEIKEDVLSVLYRREPGFTIIIHSVTPAAAEDKWMYRIDIQLTQKK